MAVWLVRAGRGGEEERVALNKGGAVIGWDEMRDLSTVSSREELRTLCEVAFPAASRATISNYVGQLWAFSRKMREGDLVVLPLKTAPGKIAIGRVDGPYRYRLDLPAHARHTHDVSWVRTDIPRSAFAEDLLAHLNLPKTVTPILADRAEERIGAVADGRADPGPRSDAVPAEQRDRQSPEYARAVLERLYRDDEERHAVLQVLSRTIREAHRLGPKSWEVTLFPTWFRLNVGRVWMAESRPNGLALLLDGASLDEGTEAELASIGRLAPSGLKAISDTLSTELAAEWIEVLLEEKDLCARLEALHFKAVERAVKDCAKAVWARAHSPGLLEYMRAELPGEEIPDPDLPLKSSPARIDASDLRAAFERFRNDPIQRFRVRVRRLQAAKLRQLLSTPDTVDLRTFNQEIWQLESKTYLRGEDISRTIFAADDRIMKRLPDLEAALEADDLDFHGNAMWGSASRVYAPMLKDDLAKTSNIRRALSVLNDRTLTPAGQAQAVERIHGFGPNIATGLVMAFHPDDFAIYNTASKEALRRLNLPEGTLEEFERSMCALKQELGAQDFIELDWFLYLLNQGAYGDRGLADSLRPPASVERVEEPHIENLQGGRAPHSAIERLADELYVTADWLQEIRVLLEEKRQIIFYGPPGTGKTYIAQKLARFITGDSNKVRIVQFHPSYSYEDFVEGYRPTLDGDRAGFHLEKGPLKEIAEEAGAHPEDTYVLLIDEINRGNLAKVFGELYFLLEYRSEKIRLLYSRHEFALPQNLWIIGTMNTADRSIALVDAALRRRFYFVPFDPSKEPIRGVLRRWLLDKHLDLVWVADVVQRANERIGDRNLGIGPSYFMRTALNEEWVERIWNHSVYPYLEEQFFGDEARLDLLRLNRLRRLAQEATASPPIVGTVLEPVASPHEAPNGHDTPS